MSECLVTKLKGIVDNDNLPIYGAIKVKVGNGEFDFGVCNKAGTTISWNNVIDQITLSNGTVITSPYTFPVGSENAMTRFVGTLTRETTFVITNKYNITRIYDNTPNVVWPSLEELKYADIREFRNRYGVITDTDNKSISELITMFPNITALDFAGFKITGNISSLAVWQNLTEFSSVDHLANVAFEGNIESLASLISLGGSGANDFRTPNVTGTLEGLVEGQVSNGRNSGNMILQLGLSAVTLNNTEVNKTIRITFTASEVSIDGTVLSDHLATYDVTSGTWTYAE